MKIKCLSKNRDRSGNIVSYTLQDETGRVFEADSKQLKREMKSPKYDFINIQLDKAGRLVDKAVNNEISDQEKALELGYQLLMQGKDVGFGIIKFNGSTWDLLSEKRIKKALNKGKQKVYPIDFASKFQNYVYQKGYLAPYCLYVKSKDGAVEMVNFCMNKSEIRLKGFIQEYAGGCEKYLRPENYNIRAYRLDNPNQPIITYAEPDMKLVGTVGNANKEQEESRMTSREFLINLFSKFIKFIR